MHDGLTVYTTYIGAVRKEKDDCRRIKWLFDGLKLQYHEIDVGDTRFVRKKLSEKSKTTSLPQAFVGENYVGTYDEIEIANDDGNLREKLDAAGYKEVPNFVKESPFDDYEDEEVEESEGTASPTQADPGGTVLSGGWIEYFTDDGEPYYHNPDTNETVWDKPEAACAPGDNEAAKKAQEEEEEKAKQRLQQEQAEQKKKQEEEERQRKEAEAKAKAEQEARELAEKEKERHRKEQEEEERRQREREAAEAAEKAEQERKRKEREAAEEAERLQREKERKQEEERKQREQEEQQRREQEERERLRKQQEQEEQERLLREQQQREKEEKEKREREELLRKAEAERIQREKEQQAAEQERARLKQQQEEEEARKAQLLREQEEEARREQEQEDARRQREEEEEKARLQQLVERLKREEAEREARKNAQQPYMNTTYPPPMYSTPTSSAYSPHSAPTTNTQPAWDSARRTARPTTTSSAYGSANRRDYTDSFRSPSNTSGPYNRPQSAVPFNLSPLGSSNRSGTPTSNNSASSSSAPSASSGKVNVWIDTDCAAGLQGCEIDDALALAYCLRSTEINVLGISCVFGNACVDEVHRITCDVVSKFNAAGNIPILKGAAVCTDLGKPTEATQGLVRALESSEETVVLLCLGPLTNVATFTMLHPLVARKVSKIVISAGLRENNEMSWPLSDMPDYNFEADWMAAAILLKTGIPLVYIPLECAGHMWFNNRDVQGLARDKSEGGQYLYKICLQWLEFWRDNFRMDSFIARDVLAAAATTRYSATFTCSTLYTWVQQRTGAGFTSPPKPCLVATTSAATTAVRPRTCSFCHTPHPQLKPHILDKITLGSISDDF